MSEITHIIEAILGTGILSTIVTFFLTRKKYLAEVSTIDIESMRKSLDFYIDMVDDNKKRIEYYQNEIERCNQEMSKLRNENIDLRKQLQEVSNQVMYLMSKENKQ